MKTNFLSRLVVAIRPHFVLLLSKEDSLVRQFLPLANPRASMETQHTL